MEFKPIFSHHSWYGMLYLKGLVWLFAPLVPLLWTTMEVVILAQIARVGQLGLALTFMLALYSFGENPEMLAYLASSRLALISSALRCGVAPGYAAIGTDHSTMLLYPDDATPD